MITCIQNALQKSNKALSLKSKISLCDSSGRKGSKGLLFVSIEKQSLFKELQVNHTWFCEALKRVTLNITKEPSGTLVSGGASTVSFRALDDYNGVQFISKVTSK